MFRARITENTRLLNVFKKYGFISRLETKELSKESLDKLANDAYNYGEGRHLLNNLSEEERNKKIDKIKKDIVNIVKFLVTRDDNLSELDLKISSKIYELCSEEQLDEIDKLLSTAMEPIITGHEAEENNIIFPNIFNNYYWDTQRKNTYKFEINKVSYLYKFSRHNYTVGHTETKNYVIPTLWTSQLFAYNKVDECFVSCLYVRIDDKSIIPNKMSYSGKTVEFKNNAAEINFSFTSNLYGLESFVNIYFNCEKIPSRPIPVVIKVVYIHLSSELKLSISDNYSKLSKFIPEIKKEQEPPFGFTMYDIIRLDEDRQDGNNVAAVEFI